MLMISKSAKHDTLVELHIRQRLPLVHRHEPSLAFSSTTEINDEFVLVISQRLEYRL